ncbi:MAG: regulator [Candidatus Omnitrophota bacterium]|jgi:sugar lactone lactonase YvrE|nr:MAG: regulator [Candidatus Omnitrophota bacterium]
MIHPLLLWGLITVFCVGNPTSPAASIADDPFLQEYREAYPIPASDAANDVRAIAVDQNGWIYAATKNGLFTMRNGEWIKDSGVTNGPVFNLFVDQNGDVWIGAWDGLYRINKTGTSKIADVDLPITIIVSTADGMIVMGPDGACQQNQNEWRRIDERWSRNVRAAALDPNGDLWIATGVGLYRQNADGLRRYYRGDELISAELNALAVAEDGRLWIGGLGGIDVYENGTRTASFTNKEGLPYYDVRSLTFAPDGTLWAGTALGVARFDGVNWSLRHSRRWLLSDDVRDIAFDAEGAVWIATAGGVSAIKKRVMTLAEKAEYYLDICLKRHVRPPGLVEKCFFPDPNDLTQFLPRDDDNDGQYTAMYLAMESLRFAVTKDPQAKANADQAYDALEFLQTVTQTDGFVARTVVPATWTEMADANEKVSPAEAVERRVHDPRYKVVETRWRPSVDGKWLWKGDTSSDEITGHMFGYLFYYDLAADDAQKERIRRHVGKIMDHIIDGGYVLRDLDGEATRWGVWSPEKLNHDPDWQVERPINSFEILSFLKTTYHITSNEKYQHEYINLIENHGYAENVRRPKAYGLSERTHIDDELLALAAPGLLLYENDPRLRSIYLEGLTWAYRTIEQDQNPFNHFIFALVGGTNFHLEDSVAFLRDCPLDLRQWTVDNSRREDIQLVRRPMLEPLQLDRMLPPSERGVMRWDKNPWEAVSGDFHDAQGRLESCGVFWLLPYWLGRYCDLISSPGS